MLDRMILALTLPILINAGYEPVQCVKNCRMGDTADCKPCSCDGTSSGDDCTVVTNTCACKVITADNTGVTCTACTYADASTCSHTAEAADWSDEYCYYTSKAYGENPNDDADPTIQRTEMGSCLSTGLQQRELCEGQTGCQWNLDSNHHCDRGQPHLCEECAGIHETCQSNCQPETPCDSLPGAPAGRRLMDWSFLEGIKGAAEMQQEVEDAQDDAAFQECVANTDECLAGCDEFEAACDIDCHDQSVCNDTCTLNSASANYVCDYDHYLITGKYGSGAESGTCTVEVANKDYTTDESLITQRRATHANQKAPAYVTLRL